MSDFFTNRAMRLPPWLYKGENSVDPSGLVGICSTLVPQSWAGRLISPSDPVNLGGSWPILWDGQTYTNPQELDLSPPSYTESALTPGFAPRCPRALFLDLGDQPIYDAIAAAVGAQLQELGVRVGGEGNSAPNVFGPGLYLYEDSAAATDDNGDGGTATDVVAICSPQKFIGGDLLAIFLLPPGGAVGGGVGWAKFLDPGYLYIEFSNYIAASTSQLAAAAARFRKIQVVNLYEGGSNDGGCFNAGASGSYAKAPPCVKVQFLGSDTTVATDAEIAAAAIGWIKTFFGIT
jgi:hypothetical protein